MIVSMNDVLRGRNSYSKSITADKLSFRVEKASKLAYMAFSIGLALVEQAGWKLGDYINFVWDSAEKTGFFESATLSTGKPLHKYSTKILQVRFPYVEGYELPYSIDRVGADNVKVKKGKIAFALTVEVDKKKEK